MGIPQFESNGLLGHGRFSCRLAEFEQAFVLDASLAASTSRPQIFADFLSALNLLAQFADRLVERVWFGGSFTSSKVDPDDIDATFILNEEIYSTLSEEKQDSLRALLQVGGFKQLGLSVDGFMLVRQPIANPWTREGGVRSNATSYLGKRGAWDDWWSRHRIHGTANEAPKLEDSPPRRGYVEVIINE